MFRLSSRLVDTVPRAPTYHDSERAPDDLQLERIYQRNVSTISAINRSRRIRSLFVGQLLNRAKLTDGKYGWLVLVRDKEAWPLQARFNDLLKARATADEDTYIDAGIDRFTPDDFSDNGHFSKAGAAKFAAAIAPAVRAQCAGAAASR